MKLARHLHAGLLCLVLLTAACATSSPGVETSSSAGDNATTAAPTTTAAATPTAPTTTAAPTTTVAATTSTAVPVIAPDGYPFADVVDLDVFDLYRHISSVAGDCAREQEVRVSEEMSVETDETVCGENSATDLYYLLVMDEPLRVHTIEAAADPDTPAGDPRYVVTERIYDFEADPPTVYERTGRTAFAAYDTLDTAFTASPIGDPAATAADLLARRDEGGPDHYICYTEDTGSAPDLLVAFDATDIALWARYDGQAANVVLDLESQDTVGTSLVDRYTEYVAGTPNGTYTLTHEGIWGYVTYDRPDGQQFSFTIDHTRSVDDGGAYRTTPCL